MSRRKTDQRRCRCRRSASTRPSRRVRSMGNSSVCCGPTRCAEEASRDQAGWHGWCHQFQRSHLSSFKVRWAAMVAVD
eukprot:12310008-Karenia_brevis.AAC.1